MSLAMKIYPDRIDELDAYTTQLLRPCLKKPKRILATKIADEFNVRTHGDIYIHGKEGDYLMCDLDGALYVMDGMVFQQSYEWIID
jgi:hypothetical protein